MNALARTVAFGTLALAGSANAQLPYYVGYAPVYATPVYAAPAPVVVYRPLLPVAPVVAPRVVVTASPVVVYPAVTPVVTTRYRPLLGGSVSRVRYYAPAYGY